MSSLAGRLRKKSIGFFFWQRNAADQEQKVCRQSGEGLLLYLVVPGQRELLPRAENNKLLSKSSFRENGPSFCESTTNLTFMLCV